MLSVVILGLTWVDLTGCKTYLFDNERKYVAWSNAASMVDLNIDYLYLGLIDIGQNFISYVVSCTAPMKL